MTNSEHCQSISTITKQPSTNSNHNQNSIDEDHLVIESGGGYGG